MLIAAPMSFPAGLRYTVKDRPVPQNGGCDMEYKLELVLIPVSDVDRAKKFYLEQAGFDLIVDTPIGEGKRVVQLNPPGSACSIGFGTGLTSAAPGSAQGLHLVVPDILAARAELTGRGLSVSEVHHLEAGTWVDGPHPQRGNYESFADFTDPDGNIWILQEVNRAKADDGAR
jgi:catechol 2,3-dioxygenase-like lactoylglutathione lyase family enzyme